MPGARIMTPPGMTYAADGTGLVAIALTFAGFLPPIAAILAGCWYLVQIYESKTVQAWIERRALARRARKLLKLEAKRLVLAAEIDAIEKVRVARAYGAEKVEEAKSDAARGMKLLDTVDKL